MRRYGKVILMTLLIIPLLICFIFPHQFFYKFSDGEKTMMFSLLFVAVFAGIMLGDGRHRGPYDYLPHSLKILSGDLDIADDLSGWALNAKLIGNPYKALSLYNEARKIYSHYNEIKSIKKCDEEIRPLKLEIANNLMDDAYKAKKKNDFSNALALFIEAEKVYCEYQEQSSIDECEEEIKFLQTN